MSRPESRGVLRNRNFALLWGGQTVSVVGNGVFAVALPLEVLRLTDSALNLAIVASARLIPTVLFLLIGGSLVDRLPRRAVMFVSDAVCGIAVCAAGILIAADRLRLWELLLISIVMGLANAFFMPASTAIARDILPPSQLVPGSSLTSLSQSLGQYLAGPLAGGIIVAWAGTAWAFGIDGVSFVLSACCLAAMRKVVSSVEARSSSIAASIRAGLRYTRSQRWLWWSIIALGIANLVSFVPLIILEALLVKHVFGAGPVALGVMYSASGTGGALASLYVKRAGAPRNRLGAMWASWTGAGLAAVLLGLSPSIWMATVFAGLIWGAITYGNVLWFPLMQEQVPPGLLGRVSSLDWMISLALSPAGTIFGGALAGIVGVRLTLVIGGVVAACTGSVVLMPGVQEPARRHALEPSGE